MVTVVNDDAVKDEDDKEQGEAGRLPWRRILFSGGSFTDSGARLVAAGVTVAAIFD
jgi:hypothetical protein